MKEAVTDQNFINEMIPAELNGCWIGILFGKNK